MRDAQFFVARKQTFEKLVKASGFSLPFNYTRVRNTKYCKTLQGTVYVRTHPYPGLQESVRIFSPVSILYIEYLEGDMAGGGGCRQALNN